MKFVDIFWTIFDRRVICLLLHGNCWDKNFKNIKKESLDVPKFGE